MSPSFSFSVFGLVVLFLLNAPIANAYLVNRNVHYSRLQVRQSASSNVAPATTSQSTADRLIENIDRLDDSIRNLPNDALNFLSEVGNKIDALETLFKSIIGSTTPSASAADPTPRLPIPTSLLAINSTANETIQLPNTIVPTPVSEDPILSVLPILDSLIAPLITTASAGLSSSGNWNGTSLPTYAVPGSAFTSAPATGNATTPTFHLATPSVAPNLTVVPSLAPLNSTTAISTFANATSRDLFANTTVQIPTPVNVTTHAISPNVTATSLFLNTTSFTQYPNSTFTAPLANVTSTFAPLPNVTPNAHPFLNTSSTVLPFPNVTSNTLTTTPFPNATFTGLYLSNATSSSLHFPNSTLSALYLHNATASSLSPQNATTTGPAALNITSSFLNDTIAISTPVPHFINGTNIISVSGPQVTAAPANATALSAAIANITSVLSVSTFNATLLADLLRSNLTSAQQNVLTTPTATLVVTPSQSNITKATTDRPPMSISPPLSYLNTTRLTLPTHMPIPVSALSAAAMAKASHNATASLLFNSAEPRNSSAVVEDTESTTTMLITVTGATVTVTPVSEAELVTTVLATSTDAVGATTVFVSTLTVTTTVFVTPSPIEMEAEVTVVAADGAVSMIA